LRLPLKQKGVHLQTYFGRKGAVDSDNNSKNSNEPVLRDMDPSSLSDQRTRVLFNIYDRAARKYIPQPYDGRLTLLRCPLGYGRKEIRSPHPHLGWLPLVRHLETHPIQAMGHLALLQEPAVTTVGQILQASLSQAFSKSQKSDCN
jgi:thioesterase domain-containing protein